MMLRSRVVLPAVRVTRLYCTSEGDKPSPFEVTDFQQQLARERQKDPEPKNVKDFVTPHLRAPESGTKVQVKTEESQLIDGIPEEHVVLRRAKIYRPSKEASQSGWANTKRWKVELDNRERWENPLMGWSSSGDPLSNIHMMTSFASKEDAVRYCEKHRWQYEIEEPQERQILPKNYASNFSWSKRTRVGTK